MAQETKVSDYEFIAAKLCDATYERLGLPAEDKYAKLGWTTVWNSHPNAAKLLAHISLADFCPHHYWGSGPGECANSLNDHGLGFKRHELAEVIATNADGKEVLLTYCPYLNCMAAHMYNNNLQEAKTTQFGTYLSYSSGVAKIDEKHYLDLLHGDMFAHLPTAEKLRRLFDTVLNIEHQVAVHRGAIQWCRGKLLTSSFDARMAAKKEAATQTV